MRGAVHKLKTNLSRAMLPQVRHNAWVMACHRAADGETIYCHDNLSKLQDLEIVPASKA